MFQKFHILLIITLLGCLATPMKSYACGAKSKKTEHSCCIKEKAEKSKKYICCAKHKIAGHKKDNSCGGNCDNSTCSCPSTFSALVMPNFLIKIDINSFTASKVVKSFYNETFYSFDFGYIWTPPNIG